MEGLKKRAYALGAIFALAGGFYQVSGAAKGPERTEPWMQKTAITRFGKYKTESNLPGDVTYKMDKTTYDALQPFGIVARIMDDGRKGFDVTLIASANKNSFHDPRVCFAAQGWELSQEQPVKIETQTRGIVTATVTQLKGKDGVKWGAFFYRGPEGFSPTTLGLKWQMFKRQMFHGENAEGVFYRFIPSQSDTTKEELAAFVRDYLDASNGPTKGYF